MPLAPGAAGPPSPPVVLGVAVVSHPRRADVAEALRARHPELDMRVVYDPDPGGPPTALRTLREACRTVPEEVTHCLVLQDDVGLVDGFREQVLAMLRHPPAGALSVFADWSGRNSSMVRLAVLTGHCWAPGVDVFTPTQGLLLTREVAVRMAEFLTTQAQPPEPDDLAVRRFLAGVGVPSLICVPNLVEHRHLASIVGNDHLGERPSACFVDPFPAEWPWAPAVLRTEAVPYLRWHTGLTHCLRPGPAGEPWRIEDVCRFLTERGTTSAEVLSRRPVRAPEYAEIRAAVPAALLDQIWLASHLLGAAAADGGAAPVLARLDRGGPVVEAALYTLAAGTIRHLVGLDVARRNRLALTRYVAAGARDGASS